MLTLNFLEKSHWIINRILRFVRNCMKAMNKIVCLAAFREGTIISSCSGIQCHISSGSSGAAEFASLPFVPALVTSKVIMGKDVCGGQGHYLNMYTVLLLKWCKGVIVRGQKAREKYTNFASAELLLSFSSPKHLYQIPMTKSIMTMATGQSHCL